MRVVLTSEAERELVAVLDWYAAQAPNLVRRFVDEYDRLVQRLAENPLQFPAARGTIRPAGFNRFPYGLFFRVRFDVVEVIGCLHGSRDPRHWRRRAQ